jgi:ribosome-binding factor A
MPKEYSRSLRVGDLIQRELAYLIQRHVNESGLGIVTVSAVKVSTDLKNATIYITSLGNTAGNEQVVGVLNEHANQFRQVLTKLLTMRIIPRLRFEYDLSLERANRLTELIDSLKTGKNQDNGS